MIKSQDLVKDMIAKYPETKEVFAAHGVDLDRLVVELNERATGHGG